MCCSPPHGCLTFYSDPICASIAHGPFSVSFLHILVTPLFFIRCELVSRPACSHLIKSVHFLHFGHSGSSGLYSAAHLPFSLTMLCAPRFQDCYPDCSSTKRPTSSLLGLNPPIGSLKAPSHDPHFPFPCMFSPVAIHLPWRFKHYAFPKRWLLGVKGHIPEISDLHSYCHENLGSTILEIKLLRWTCGLNCKIWIMERFIVPAV